MDPEQELDRLSKQLAQAETFTIHPLILGRIQGFIAGVGLAVMTVMLEHLLG